MLTSDHQVTDYGGENPLLYDYYGFQPALYKLKFKSRGDSGISQRVVELFKEVSIYLEIRRAGFHMRRPVISHGLRVKRKVVAKMAVGSADQALITACSYRLGSCLGRSLWMCPSSRPPLMQLWIQLKTGPLVKL